MAISTGPIKDLKESPPNITWGTARLRLPAQVYLHIVGTAEPVRIRLTRPFILGRVDRDEPTDIDVDLTPYKAVEKGVSRRHMKLELVKDTVSLTDLGSTNGTFLNGQRLQPFQSRIVRDGDEIRLGKLSVRIYF
jgi:pSer/pThr/pTyr-binding forkhead associated (FHA) protein